MLLWGLEICVDFKECVVDFVTAHSLITLSSLTEHSLWLAVSLTRPVNVKGHLECES